MNFLFVFSQNAKYSFVKEELNNIQNAEGLDDFFKSLQNSQNQKVSVLHIGDSHLQPNFISDVVRSGLQEKFGNAGRGIIVPYKVAGTNSPADITSKSTQRWEGKRNCKPLLPQATGIGGITIESKDSTASFSFKIPEKYAFTNMKVFFQNDENSYGLFAKDLINGDSLNLKDFILSENENIASVTFSQPTTEVEFESFKTDSIQNHTTVFGIYTENDQNGVIYNSVGVNGSEYFHFDEAEFFNEETPFLHPNLIIISLGTNEAFRKNFDEEEVENQMQSFISNLKELNPEASFLITIPANSFKNKKINQELFIVQNLLIKIANDNHLAYWNLPEITGEAANWRKNKLLRPDGVHYEKNAYLLQGELLYNALISAYENYVSKH